MKIHRDNVEHIKSSRANKKTFNIVETICTKLANLHEALKY